MSIKREHTLHPITAIEFYRNQDGALLVLAGEGPFLKLFEAETSELLCQCEVFAGQTIHGITVRKKVSQERDLQVAIWGGSSLKLLRHSDFHQLLNQDVSSIVDATSSISDWILDVAISPSDDGSCVLMTAHNTVIRAKLEFPSNYLSLEELFSPSRSILYSAHLDWDSHDRVLVAAGTVFGEIIVWECSIPGDAATSEGRVLFNFTGHEGSIFGVNISPPIVRPDKTASRLLASCSDDRTIRIWDLSIGSAAIPQNSDANQVRETGFGENGEITQDTSMAMAMGHASRIWRVKFLVDGHYTLVPKHINILSFGEDSTAQQWSLEFGSPPQTTENRSSISSETSQDVSPVISGHLTNEKVSAFHSGKHIWSAATRDIDGQRSVLATGGADGKISVYEVEILGNTVGHLNPSESRDDTAGTIPAATQSVWELEHVLGTLLLYDYHADAISEPPVQELPAEDLPSQENPTGKTPKKKKSKKAPKDAFNRYAFASENKVLVTTTFGRVLLGNIRAGVIWEELFLPESAKDDLKSYSMVKDFTEMGVVFLAGTNGKIYAYYGVSMLSEFGCVDGKVADMFEVVNPKTKSLNLLVTTLGGKSATLFAIDQPLEGSFTFSAQLAYDLPEKFVVTSAGRAGSVFVLGSRSGSMAVYDAENQAKPPFLWTPDEALSGDAITTIIPLTVSTLPENVDEIYFLTTSRRGVYSVFACHTLRDPFATVTEAALRPVHHGTPPFGPMVENAWFSNKELILYGFKGKNFVAWNETKQCEVTNVECGGAHRSYAYSPVGEGGHFIYTKASKLYLHTQLKPSHRIIKKGGHGREIKACAVSPDRTLIATGAEDTSIRIWNYKDSASPRENEFGSLAIVQKHTAGIQHLQWHGSRYLFSSGGNEEFFVWAVEQIPGFGIGIVCEATCPDQSEDRDLRIMSFDVTELPLRDFQHETTLLVSFAYSDSTIRMYTYSKTTRFCLTATGKYTSSCLMQIRHINVSDKEIYLLTAATDGILTLWRGDLSPTPSSNDTSSKTSTQELTMLSTKKVHQSSIKSLDISTTPSKSHTVVVTGGDDNALAISLYSTPDPTLIPKSFILRAAHFAAITGLCFMPGSKAEDIMGKCRVVSSSNDQRIKEWDISISIVGPDNQCVVEIRQVGDVFTAVADVGDVACLRDGEEGKDSERKVLIVGNGMEAWNVSQL